MFNIDITQIIYRIPAILVGFTLHEFMHAFVADRLGDPTPRSQGRVTLNPVAHIDPIGILMLLLMGFGWARPVMTNPSNYSNRKKGQVLVSMAGPLTNLALALIFFAGWYFASNVISSNIHVYFFYINLIRINIFLFAFNMIPVPPLDGFSLLEMFIHPSKYRTLAIIRQYGFIIIILLMFTGIIGVYLSAVENGLEWVFTLICSSLQKLIMLF